MSPPLSRRIAQPVAFEMCTECGIEQHRCDRRPCRPTTPRGRATGLIAPDSVRLREPFRRSDAANFLHCRGTLPAGCVLRAKSV